MSLALHMSLRCMNKDSKIPERLAKVQIKFKIHQFSIIFFLVVANKNQIAISSYHFYSEKEDGL